MRNRVRIVLFNFRLSKWTNLFGLQCAVKLLRVESSFRLYATICTQNRKKKMNWFWWLKGKSAKMALWLVTPQRNTTKYKLTTSFFVQFFFSFSLKKYLNKTCFETCEKWIPNAVQQDKIDKYVANYGRKTHTHTKHQDNMNEKCVSVCVCNKKWAANDE